MGSRWGMLVLLGGCFHPTTAFDVPCSAAMTCPDDQICDPTRSPPTCVAALGDATSHPDDAPSLLVDAPEDGMKAAIDAPKPVVDAAVAIDAMPDAPPIVPITYVQSATAKPMMPVTTMPLGTAVTAHDALIFCLNYPSGPTISSIADSLGNPYTIVVGPLVSGGQTHVVAVALDVAGGSDTLTLTLSGSTATADMFVLEYAGLAHTNAFDVSANMSGTTAAMTSGGATTTFGHELLLGYAEAPNATTAAPYTMRVTNTGNIVEDRVVAATGTYDAGATSTQGGTWTMILATFRGM